MEHQRTVWQPTTSVSSCMIIRSTVCTAVDLYAGESVEFRPSQPILWFVKEISNQTGATAVFSDCSAIFGLFQQCSQCCMAVSRRTSQSNFKISQFRRQKNALMYSTHAMDSPLTGHTYLNLDSSCNRLYQDRKSFYTIDRYT